MHKLFKVSAPDHWKICIAVVSAVLIPVALPWQSMMAQETATREKIPVFVDPAKLNLALVLLPPPSSTSEKTKAELAEIHNLERTRTPAMAAAAAFDDEHEDMFVYSSVLGAPFQATALPLTMALSAHIRNDAGLVDNPLKKRFGRPRPYNLDTSLHPICVTNKENSYPSGHSLNGYLYAYTLAQIVPEKQVEILTRADEYAHSRVVCEAHYPTDLEASRRVALVVFGYLLASPRFTAELNAARAETRQALHLPELTVTP